MEPNCEVGGAVVWLPPACDLPVSVTETKLKVTSIPGNLTLWIEILNSNQHIDFATVKYVGGFYLAICI